MKKRRLCSVMATGFILITAVFLPGSLDRVCAESTADSSGTAPSMSANGQAGPVTNLRIPAGEMQWDAVSTALNEDGSLEIRAENAVVTAAVTVPETGTYRIRLRYIVRESAMRRTGLALTVNGKTPVDGADALTLDRPWVPDGEITTDERGNQILPDRKEQCAETEMVLSDPQGRYNEPLAFPLTAGENTLAFCFKNANVALVSVEIFNDEAVPDYAQLSDYYSQQGYRDAEGEVKLVEAEDFIIASDSTIMADFDKSDANTSPNDPALLYYNILPGARFQSVGQWVKWHLTVPQDGLYAISIRAKQDTKSGFVSTRRLRVDGQALCKETEAISFPSSSGWYRQAITANGETCRFYFEAGKTYVLSLEVIPGSLDGVLSRLEDLVYSLNSLYRSVVMVAGTDQDKYRDYKLAQQIPQYRETVTSLRKELESVLEQMLEQNGGESGSELTSIRSLITRLQQIEKDPDSLARTLSSFKSDVQTLSSWITEAKVQPVDLDYIAVHAPGAELPSVRAGFFRRISFEIQRLIASYAEDYGTVGDVYGKDDSISVWLSGGRDQLDVLKKLIDNDFSKNEKINVNLSLVSTNVREAVLANKAPDVAVFLAGDEPVNLAIRHAVTDLSQFPDFDDVIGRFRKDATASLRYDGGCYGLPLTEIYPMMFVRTDILEELGLEAPDTWEEMYTVAAVLQRKNMEIGIPSNIGMYATLLYQNGGSFFTEDLRQTRFDSEEAVDAFVTWTNFFSRYGFPLSFDFYNRFRSGEMPIGIAAYTTYTMLESAAPEINGRWEMLPVPATVRKDGTVSRAVSISNATGATTSPGLEQNMAVGVIFATSKQQEKAWRFLNWFTEADTQVEYGNAVEAVMGPTARYATANVEAFSRLPWDTVQREELLKQWEQVVLIPEVPGNYYVTRELNNAFRKVIYDYDNAVDTLNRYNVRINKELFRKRQQLDRKK